MNVFYFYELQQRMEGADQDSCQFFIYTDKVVPPKNTVYMGKLEVDSGDVSVAFAEFIKSLGQASLEYSIRTIDTNPEAWLAEFQTA